MPTASCAGPATVSVDRARGGAAGVARGPRPRAARRSRSPEAAATPTDPLLSGCYPMAPFAGRTRGGRFAWDGRSTSWCRTTPATPCTAPCSTGGGCGAGRRRLRAAARRPAARLALRRLGHPRGGAAARPRSSCASRCTPSGPTFPPPLGWHPWFRRRIEVGGSLEVDLDAKRWYPRGVDGLPSASSRRRPPEGPWDDCFTAVTWPVAPHLAGRARGAHDLAPATTSCSTTSPATPSASSRRPGRPTR